MKNILIIDDETEHLRGMRVGLAARGYKVQEALDAEAALAILRNQADPIQLIITDYVMPDMDGFTLLNEIRDQGHRQPGILMTAYAEKDIVVRAIHADFSGFLEKPFTIDELLQEIQRVEEKETLRQKNLEAQAAFLKLTHQINNLLFVIQGVSELNQARKEERDEEALRSTLAVISKAAEKIMDLNTELLNRTRNVPNAELGTRNSEYKLTEHDNS